MKTADEVKEDILKIQATYYRNAVIFALIFVGLAITLALVLPSENVGIWKLVIPAALGVGGLSSPYLTVFRSLQKAGPLQELKRLQKKLNERELENPIVNAFVLLRPRDVEEYYKLFEGFTECTFKAYQAPFALEDPLHRKRVSKKALETHLKRYEEGVESRYLFYDRGSYDRAVNFFKKLQKQALQKGETLAEKIQLKCLPKQSSPTHTFFTGKRSESPRCILYPSVTLRQGLPDAVIVIDGAKYLLKILSDYFDEEWESVGKSAHTVSWKPENRS